jgi:hypothetical protein
MLHTLQVISMAGATANLQPTLAAAAQHLASPLGPAANLQPLEFREMTAALAEVQITATTTVGPGEHTELQEWDPMIAELSAATVETPDPDTTTAATAESSQVAEKLPQQSAT